MKTTAATPVIRLTKRPDFVRLNRRGVRVVTKGFVLQYWQREGEEDGPVRLGFTATKKFAKAAVERNRAKRRLRAVTDDVMRLNPNFTAPAWDVCLIARFAVNDLPYERLITDLTKALCDAGATT